MKIKAPTEFLTFSDGRVAIHEMRNNKPSDQPVEVLNFGDRVVGMKRLYAARTASSEINRLVHVPMRPYITTKHCAVIEGKRYKIDAVQSVYDSNPPVNLLTLIYMGAGI